MNSLPVIAFAVLLAQNFTISGNGAGSTNSLNTSTSSTTVLQQSNSANVVNNIDANANTGGNTTDNGSIRTGDATVNVHVTNNLNSNTASVTCCGTPTPKVSIVPSQIPTATPTPSSNSGGGDGEHNNNGGGGGGQEVGGKGGGEILGLAGTSGTPVTEYLLYGVGALCLGLAKKLFTGAK